jgi:hypothetical protein
MPNEDDDFDTEIDKRPLQPPLDATSESVSKMRTAIDHDLAKHLLQAFPEKFKQPDPPAGSSERLKGDRSAEPVVASHLPRTVLQAPLSISPSKTRGDQDVFDAPISSTDIPLARLGQVLRRIRTSLASVPASVRTLLAALVLAGVVGLGWWLNYTPAPVSQTVPRKPAGANTPRVSSVQNETKRPNSPPQHKKVTSPAASDEQATPVLSSVAETEAARAFIKGQRIEALNLYQRLSKQFPERKVYGVAIEVLQRSLQHSCNNGVTVEGEACIEN